MVRTRSTKYTEKEEGFIPNGKQNGSLGIDNTYEKINGKSPIKNGKKPKKNGTTELTMRELKSLNKKENIKVDQNGDLSSEESVSSPLQLSAAASTSDSGSVVKEPTKKPLITDAANALATDSTNTLSYAVSLTQSLLSSDSKRIDDILTGSISQREIKDTVKDLPTIHVIRLLKYIEEKLRGSTGGHVELLIRWSGIVISTHMSYLMTVSDLEKQLGSFFSWIKSRVSHMEALFILNGKLRLLCEQIDKRCNVVSYADQKPSMVFHPDDESDDELEKISALEKEVFDAANEDDEWWKEDEEIQEKLNVKEISKKKKGKKRHAEEEDSDEDMEISNQSMEIDDDDSENDE
uniref:Utp12 domain-containing protein n=1 Tax=Strongyloides venezuelensis TaxID=75913 RepID=A0A0K0F203_STRVS